MRSIYWHYFNILLQKPKGSKSLPPKATIRASGYTVHEALKNLLTTLAKQGKLLDFQSITVSRDPIPRSAIKRKRLMKIKQAKNQSFLSEPKPIDQALKILEQ